MQLTWAMPLVGLYAVWDKRRELAKTPARASLWGVAATAASLALHVLAFRAQQPRVSLFTVATSLWSACWAIWGWGVARQLLFPLGYTILSFLCFHIKHYTTSLQVFASNLSVVFLRGFGVDAANIGSVIRVSFGPETQPLVFNVAEGCSGLRSLVVLSALAAPYAYFRVRGNLRAWILFAMSVPLAILTNILRISTLTLFAFCFGSELAMQIYHDPAGFLVFFIGILLLQATATFLDRDWAAPIQRIREALRRRFGGKWDSPEVPEVPEAPDVTESSEAPAARWRLPVATALLVLFIGLSARHLSRPRVFRGAPNCPLDVLLPEELGPYHGEEVLFCTNDQCCRDYPRSEFPEDGEGLTCPVCSSPLDTISIGERNGLPPGTPILRRIYTLGKNSQPVQVSIVYSGLERNSIHRPQRCLVSQVRRA
jgi:exosortase